MSLAEVEQIIGLPPGDYGRDKNFGVAEHAGPPAPARHWKNWAGDHWIISVEFDPEGKVSSCALVDRRGLSVQKQTRWERVKALLGY
jgi:hypothetical protein